MKLLKAHLNKTLARGPSQSPGMSMRDIFLASVHCMAGFRETEGFFQLYESNSGIVIWFSIKSVLHVW